PVSPVVDGDDVRVVEAGGRLGLGVEELELLRAQPARAPQAEDLDRDLSAEIEVPGEINAREAALAELADHLEAFVDDVAGTQLHRRAHLRRRGDAGEDAVEFAARNRGRSRGDERVVPRG